MKAMRRFVSGSIVLAAMLIASGAGAIQVGQKAPDFTLEDSAGKKVSLADLTAKGPVVLYTFIQAFTPT